MFCRVQSNVVWRINYQVNTTAFIHQKQRRKRGEGAAYHLWGWSPSFLPYQLRLLIIIEEIVGDSTFCTK